MSDDDSIAELQP